ncbi:hypothetical protein COCNU_14G003620 [Cocos nucifera]|uniref:S1 motif domain-containing protein n=1 Tax=Cocos nucifera TaxID=13894 RepID=A0A8K0IW08_COCNU|nr:hypothetical protein COCNU_14G003620 [Cocos nucifera]
MYEAKYPDVDMAVMIQVKHIADMGAYVSLLEYNNIEGMILFSELSRRRIRSVSSLIKVGRQEPVMVLRVDREKGYIDLSKRRVSEEDIHACEERYNKSKLVHSIMRHVAETMDLDLKDLYIHVGWPLYRKYGHAFEAFKLIVTNPDSVLDSVIREVKEVGPDGQEVTKVVPAMTPEVKDCLVKNIRRRMTPQPLKIRADVEMKCFQFDGVLHIKAAMKKAEAAGNDDCPVKIKLVAPPLYVLTTQTLDKVSERDDNLLAEHMAKLRSANEEVDGDEDSEEEEDTGMGDVDLDKSVSWLIHAFKANLQLGLVLVLCMVISCIIDSLLVLRPWLEPVSLKAKLNLGSKNMPFRISTRLKESEGTVASPELKNWIIL